MTEKKPTQAAINAAILERLEQLNKRLEEAAPLAPPPVAESTPNPLISSPAPTDPSPIPPLAPSPRRSPFLWLDKNWKAVLIGILIGFAIGFTLHFPLSTFNTTKSTIETITASEVADIPFLERTAVATAMRSAADRIDSDPRDETRLEARESVSRSMSGQSSRERWTAAANRIVDTIHSTDPITYAKNLRLAAQGMCK